MDCIVDIVEDLRDKKGSPANFQCYEDMEGCEFESFSFSVNQSDVLSNFARRQSQRRQADWDNLTIETNIFFCLGRTSSKNIFF